VRSALEWAQVKTLAADGASQREIAALLGLNRRTVIRMLESPQPPRYRRASADSKLDPFEPLVRRILAEWPQIKAPRMTEILREHGYEGSVDVVKRRLRALRPSNERPAQRTGYRPGQVMQLDGAELPTRPKIKGRERRIYALVGALPFSETPREKGAVEGAVRHLKSGFWPARRIASLADLDEQYADWRERRGPRDVRGRLNGQTIAVAPTPFGLYCLTNASLLRPTAFGVHRAGDASRSRTRRRDALSSYTYRTLPSELWGSRRNSAPAPAFRRTLRPHRHELQSRHRSGLQRGRSHRRHGRRHQPMGAGFRRPRRRRRLQRCDRRSRALRGR